MKKNYIKKMTYPAAILSAALILSLSACGASQADTDAASVTEEIQTEVAAETEALQTEAEVITENATNEDTVVSDENEATKKTLLTASDISINDTLSDSEDGGHAIEVDGEEAGYSNIKVEKTGEADGDEADFYGENAAIFATNSATLGLSEIVVETDGTHANGVFSYGEGTTVNISDSVIETSGNCSGGLMTTGGGTMNAENLTIHTTGNSSAAIRSDRGGGTVNVTGGDYTTDGVGSPVIYSTADITVNDATLTSTSSQGVVVEGKNSVTLNDVDLTADNNSKNSDKSDYYQAVMIYQSMSGDAADGESSFTMNGGSLTNKNGDIFFVNNTVTTITLDDVDITNEDSDGVFLRACAAGWGNEGSNGGQVTLNASSQEIDQDIIVDDVSTLNLYLSDGSSFTGAINTEGTAGDVYVELTDGSTWTLTADSYITSLSCDADSINLNGYTLYVDGTAYEEGSVSTGEAVESKAVSTGTSQGGPGGSAPDGNSQGGPGLGEAPPEKPDGSSGGPGETPPEKPDGSSGGPDSGETPPEKPSN